MSLIPPLLVYFYSPYSMEGTSINNGKLNNAFYNTYKSPFGQSTNILLNNNPTKFSNDAVCSTCNKFATIFLKNNNDTLSDPIGNGTWKFTYLKLNQLNNSYTFSGIIMINFYDRNQFNYGTLILNVKNQFFSNICDINGNNGLNETLKLKIIYADGYYDYLNNPIIPNIQNEISVQIINGIRQVNIPKDPTGLYIPNFVTADLTGLVPSLYFPPHSSTFNNTDLIMEEYNLSNNLYLDSSITISSGQMNILSIINKNTFDSNLNDGLFFELYNINNISPLSASGNIFGLTFTYNYQVGSVGYISTTGIKYPVIVLYADGDFDYLNFNIDNDLTKFNTFVITTNADSTRTIYLPPKPSNFILPTILYPDNKILPGKTIYNKFYSKAVNNTSIYDSTIEYLNITLFNDIYDSYDPVTELFGNVIGKITIFKFIFNKNNQTYTASIVYNSFFNNEYITSIYIIKNGLDKNGALSSNQNIRSNIIASSDGYGFNSYFKKTKCFTNYCDTSIGYL
jgi:hypothetical protein